MPVAGDINPEIINVFGIDATHSSGTITGIFERPYNDGGDLDYGGELPSFTVLSGHVVAEGDSLTIDGGTYYVRNIEPDGDGLDVLRLETE